MFDTEKEMEKLPGFDDAEKKPKYNEMYSYKVWLKVHLYLLIFNFIIFAEFFFHFL